MFTMRELKWLSGKDKSAYFPLYASGKVYKKYLTLKYKDVKGVDEHDFL